MPNANVLKLEREGRDNSRFLVDPQPDLEYPIEALGPILGEAAIAISGAIQAPKGIAAQSVLAAATLVAQPHIDVGRGDTLRSPVSLYFLTVADSGDRKSSVDKIALAPITHWQTQRQAEIEANAPKHRAAMEAWQTTYEACRNQFKKNQNHGKDALSSLQKQLEELEALRPSEPKIPHVLIQEPNSEGIYGHLRDGLPTLGLFSDEGVGFFGGHGMSDDSRGRTIAMMSALWGGDSITRSRANTTDSGQLIGRRLSAHLMVQPVVAKRILSDELFQGQGFLARFLICHEKTMAGTRFLGPDSLSANIFEVPAYDTYSTRLSHLLKTPLPVCRRTGALEPRVMQIKRNALAEWVEGYNQIEAENLEGGEFARMRASASKAAEIAARIAAVLAFIEQAETIERSHVQRAFVLIKYYLSSTAFREEEAFYEERDHLARELLEWIVTQSGGVLHSNDFKRISRRLFNRKAADIRKTLRHLETLGHVDVTEHGRKGAPVEWTVIR
ncbi:YfjI family protein [Marinobacter sp. DY40_1A1]|uniref:YfjI family protein n=1 Tax=Marinobacter sp. DY40_1A1 TaxID=2583229 RepID=UPI0019083C3C|nr:YfjI family protein [Marinobacter sp. DY40_1A1]MBK1887877.1 DUF3987 domain-containing protein [Marinobacter sp. DY40_1A1]